MWHKLLLGRLQEGTENQWKRSTTYTRYVKLPLHRVDHPSLRNSPLVSSSAPHPAILTNIITYNMYSKEHVGQCDSYFIKARQLISDFFRLDQSV